MSKVMPYRLRTLILSSILLFATLANIGLSQEAFEFPSHQEDIRGLEPFIGSWEAHLPPDLIRSLKQARPDLPIDTYKIHLSVRWVAHNSFIQFEFTEDFPDELVHVTTMIVGYCGEEHGLKVWSFWPDSVMEGKVTEAKNGTLSYKVKVVHYDRRKGTSDVTWKVDGDKLTIHVTNRGFSESLNPAVDHTPEAHADIWVTLDRVKKSD